MKKISIIITLLIISFQLFPEVFLISDLPKNGYTLALQNASFAEDKDMSVVSLNSAILARIEKPVIKISYISLMESVSLTNITYLTNRKIWQDIKFGIDISYLNYGDFDDIQNPSSTNTFSAKDFSIGCLMAKPLFKNLDLGVEIKYLSSSIDEYSASAIAFNSSILYRSPIQDINLAVGIANAGVVLDKFNTTKEELPTNIKFGLSKKLEKTPLKLYGSYNYYLEDYETYSAGVELTLKSKFKVRGSYDFNGKDREIGTNSESEKFAGFAFGAELVLKHFAIDFGYKINGELKENMAFSLSKSF